MTRRSSKTHLFENGSSYASEGNDASSTVRIVERLDLVQEMDY